MDRKKTMFIFAKKYNFFVFAKEKIFSWETVIIRKQLFASHSKITE
jgi:hypothetical protein